MILTVHKKGKKIQLFSYREEVLPEYRVVAEVRTGISVVTDSKYIKLSSNINDGSRVGYIRWGNTTQIGIRGKQKVRIPGNLKFYDKFTWYEINKLPSVFDGTTNIELAKALGFTTIASTWVVPYASSIRGIGHD